MTERLTLLTWHLASTPPTDDTYPYIFAYDDVRHIDEASYTLAWADLPALPPVGWPLGWLVIAPGKAEMCDARGRRLANIAVVNTGWYWGVQIDGAFGVTPTLATAKAAAVNALRAALAERIADDIAAYNALPLDEEETTP